MSGKPERWEIEADAAYARGVRDGLRAWHEEWRPDTVRMLEARVAHLQDEVRLARRAVRESALTPTQEPSDGG